MAALGSEKGSFQDRVIVGARALARFNGDMHGDVAAAQTPRSG